MQSSVHHGYFTWAGTMPDGILPKGSAVWLAGCKSFQIDSLEWGIAYRTTDLFSSMNQWDRKRGMGKSDVD